MGGAVSIVAPKRAGKTLFMQNYINNPKAVTMLFKDISCFGKAEGIKNLNSNLVSLADILLYIEKNINPELSEHFKGMAVVIKEAFFYIVGYKKNVRLEISVKNFQRYMNAMFMFSHLYQIFAAADDQIDDDSIFLGEFMRAKEKIQLVDGVSFTKTITDEEWKEVFKKIDSGTADDSEGWISFREFVKYCCSTIATPEEYSKELFERKQHQLQQHNVARGKTKKQSIGNHDHLLDLVVTDDIETDTGLVQQRDGTSNNTDLQMLKSTPSTPQQNNELIVNKLKSKNTQKTGPTSTKKPVYEVPSRVNVKVKEATYVQSRKSQKRKNTKKTDPRKLLQFTLPVKTLATDKVSNIGGVQKSAVPCTSPLPFEDNIDECSRSSSIDNIIPHHHQGIGMSKKTTTIIKSVDVVAQERQEEEARRKAQEEYVRPLYRPRSISEILMETHQHKAWVDEKLLEALSPTRKSWVPSTPGCASREHVNNNNNNKKKKKKKTQFNNVEAFLHDKERDRGRSSSRRDLPPAAPPSGFGINGVDMVSFTYDMVAVYEEETAHKKYRYRRSKSVGMNLWDAKYQKKKVHETDHQDKLAVSKSEQKI